MEGGASQARAIGVDPGDAFRGRGDGRAGDGVSQRRAVDSGDAPSRPSTLVFLGKSWTLVTREAPIFPHAGRVAGALQPVWRGLQAHPAIQGGVQGSIGASLGRLSRCQCIHGPTRRRTTSITTSNCQGRLGVTRVHTGSLGSRIAADEGALGVADRGTEELPTTEPHTSPAGNVSKAPDLSAFPIPRKGGTRPIVGYGIGGRTGEGMPQTASDASAAAASKPQNAEPTTRERPVPHLHQRGAAADHAPTGRHRSRVCHLRRH